MKMEGIMLRIPLKHWPAASKDPQREARVGEHLPSSHPPLPTLRLPNDRLVLALGDFGLGLSQAADAEEGPLCKTGGTLHARERRRKREKKKSKQSLGNFLVLARFIYF